MRAWLQLIARRSLLVGHLLLVKALAAGEDFPTEPDRLTPLGAQYALRLLVALP